jgi:Txe/YoeB family toxin of toxin-antitoxin system
MFPGAALVKRYQLVFTKQAQKDAKKLASSGLRPKAEMLLAILEHDPLQNPPPFEKLVGDMAGAYSRRINIQHRLVYQIIEQQQIVKVIRLWIHYD